MTSSNRARRYLQHHKQYAGESHSSPKLLTRAMLTDSTAMRKFRGRNQPVSIPQIWVNNNDEQSNENDDDIGHIAVLDEFDQVLDDELNHVSVSRTASLRQKEPIEQIKIPVNQQRSFSFALGSKPNLESEELIDILPSKTIKPPANTKSSLSKETFSRLFHSLTFRSGNHSASKIPVKRTDSQPPQHSCIACQNYPYLDFIPKHKKRPSIFGALVSKFNASTPSTPTETPFERCSVCKRLLLKSISNNDDHQHFSTTSKLRDQKQLFPHVKRRQSLPSLFHHLLDSSTTINPRSIEKLTTEFVAESEDARQSTYTDEQSELSEKSGNKDENDNEISPHIGEAHDLNSIQSNDSTLETNTNQQFLHPPEEKTRSLLVNVFRTRRSNAGLTSTESHLVGKQFSVSVLNLATSIGTNRRNSAIAALSEPAVEQRKHALSEENLPSMDNTYIYLTNSNGQTFKEKLQYSTISEETTLKEMLSKLFEKHQLSIETSNICLRSAPTLPLSLNQPVKHLLLNDLVVTGNGEGI